MVITVFFVSFPGKEVFAFKSLNPYLVVAGVFMLLLTSRVDELGRNETGIRGEKIPRLR